MVGSHWLFEVSRAVRVNQVHAERAIPTATTSNSSSVKLGAAHRESCRNDSLAMVLTARAGDSVEFQPRFRGPGSQRRSLPIGVGGGRRTPPARLMRLRSVIFRRDTICAPVGPSR